MAASDPTRAARAEAEGLPAELIRKAARGDQLAARAFFDHHHRNVHAFLWRMLSTRASRAVVDELTQDTFLRAFAALPSFDLAGPARVSSWLLTIATRVALNELRRLQRKPDATVNVELVAIPGGDAPDEAARRRALGALVERAVAALAPDHRALLVLREYHDRTLEEIASALELPLGTVQSRLARARAALREALKGVER
ncbi:MAG: RNA polymerase sigma factor [Kofleriaceae bacterium]